jgi:hypothetical protein
VRMTKHNKGQPVEAASMRHATGVGPKVHLLAFNQRRLQLRTERLEWNHRRDRHKRIVLFVETFVASVQIEEPKLSYHNLLRSEPGCLESDLHAAWKRKFFEVPRG